VWPGVRPGGASQGQSPGADAGPAAPPGASLGELMNRMGHSSTRAARIYLHTREEREQQLAATLDRMARRELKASDAKRTSRLSGTRPAIRRFTERGQAR
jgi:hypothetical protein